MAERGIKRHVIHPYKNWLGRAKSLRFFFFFVVEIRLIEQNKNNRAFREQYPHM